MDSWNCYQRPFSDISDLDIAPQSDVNEFDLQSHLEINLHSESSGTTEALQEGKVQIWNLLM
jgi:hypothetical protein